MPEISVLVPVLNGLPHLADATAAMAAQHVEGGAEYLMIDGRSTDGSREFLQDLSRRDPRFRVLDNPGRTTPRALNIGLGEARGVFIARMDAHTRYPDHYLAIGIERLYRGGVEHVSGPQVPVGSDPWSRRIACAMSTRLGSGSADYRDDRNEHAVLSGFTGVWRAETLRGLEGWDDGWPINQDVELAARLCTAGGRAVVVPAMAASYRPRNSLRALARQYGRYGHYRAKSATRHANTRRAAHLVCPTLAVAVGAAVVPGPTRSPARLCLTAYAGAVALTTARVSMPARDKLALPAVFVTMHAAWGLGYLSGLGRYGWRR